MRVQIFRKSIIEPDYDVIDSKEIILSEDNIIIEILWINKNNKYESAIYNKNEIEDMKLYNWNEK